MLFDSSDNLFLYFDPFGGSSPLDKFKRKTCLWAGANYGGKVNEAVRAYQPELNRPISEFHSGGMCY
jgi:hypothetical protein